MVVPDLFNLRDKLGCDTQTVPSLKTVNCRIGKAKLPKPSIQIVDVAQVTSSPGITTAAFHNNCC